MFHSCDPWVRIASSVLAFAERRFDRSKARWKRCVPRGDFHYFPGVAHREMNDSSIQKPASVANQGGAKVYCRPTSDFRRFILFC
jgi:hypothetical protein